MDIERLSKSQIVLLTLFTSFVTSIATGIVTFSLMQQAPPAITQTVNRIVERTVEKTASGHTALAAAPAKTIVVKESNTIASAVATIAPSVVRLYARDPENPKFLGLAVVLTSSGILAADAAALGEAGDAVAEFPSSTRVRVFVERRDAASGVAFLSAATSSLPNTAEWKPVGLAAGGAVLGQSVVAISGRSAARLGAGIVTSVDPLPDGVGATILETNIADGNIVAGSPLIDENGALVGLSTGLSRGFSAGGFVSTGALLSTASMPKME